MSDFEEFLEEAKNDESNDGKIHLKIEIKPPKAVYHSLSAQVYKLLPEPPNASKDARIVQGNVHVDDMMAAFHKILDALESEKRRIQRRLDELQDHKDLRPDCPYWRIIWIREKKPISE